MGKSAVRSRQKEQFRGRNAAESNMVVMDEYRQRTGQKQLSTINYTRRIRPLNERQEDFLSGIDTNRIMFGVGSAGSGKTKLAVAKALELLGASNQYKKLYIARPAIEAEGERLGFQPGDADAKLYPYLIPIFDELEDELGVKTLETLRKAKIIQIVPLAFMRGRTLKDAIVIMDEMQNASYSMFKMALTRLGKNSKCIVTGDPEQSDLKASQSGLNSVCAKLRHAPGIDAVFFRNEDVVRDEIVQTVLDLL